MNYNLNRFHSAQNGSYVTALAEIRAGRKRSHWIWYVFPQIAGLGFSSTSQYYAISGRGEAEAYIADPVLRDRLIEISEALLALESSSASSVMGYPDDLKLKSSMTLFAEVAPQYPVFQAVLQKFFHGQKDQRTLELLD